MAQHGGVTTGDALYGDPGYWDRMNAVDIFGLNPGGSQVRAAGQSLPLTTTTHGDHLSEWWHPDSPTFWGALIIAGTGVLIIGASFRFRVGKEAAGASVGPTKEK